MVATFAVTVTVSYGIILYAFSVVLAPMQAELGWSQPLLTGAFSLAALTAGLLAIPVGAWVDEHGPRGIMTAGSILATLLLIAWAHVENPVAYYVIWVGLGACMAAVFYEPAFTAVAQWFRRDRVLAFTILTVVAGFASPIFVPVTSWLVLLYGWREAILCLAFALGLLTVLPHALVLRRRPQDLQLRIDGGTSRGENGRAIQVPEISYTARAAIGSRGFRWLTAGFFFSTMVNFAVLVHLIALLLSRGHSLAFAGAAMGIMGLSKLPGRLLLVPFGRRWPASHTTAGIFLVQALAIAALIGIPGQTGVWIFAALFGAGEGASTPLRPAILADYFGPAAHGRISGVLALALAVARAVAALGASAFAVLAGGYDGVLWLLLALMSCAVGAITAADRHRLSPVGDGKVRGAPG